MRRMLDAATFGFHILYDDPDFLVVNKPAGLLTQAPLGIDSLEVRVKRLLQERPSTPGEIYLGVPHRLDRPVSGAILFAKSVAAARRMSKQFEWRRVEKTYWALVEGDVRPDEATWTDHLKKIEGEPRTVVANPGDPEGRNAILHYRVIQRLRPPHSTSGPRPPIPDPRSPRTLLEISLETGRTHQIRVQCASRGHPLLGDELYGSQTPFGPWSDDERQRLIALHARALRFWQHPLRQYITVTAPLPGYWIDAGIQDAAKESQP
jgi:23S rRNA pseudouridine1911/1915/1917 synthase